MLRVEGSRYRSSTCIYQIPSPPKTPSPPFCPHNPSFSMQQAHPDVPRVGMNRCSYNLTLLNLSHRIRITRTRCSCPIHRLAMLVTMLREPATAHAKRAIVTPTRCGPRSCACAACTWCRSVYLQSRRLHAASILASSRPKQPRAPAQSSRLRPIRSPSLSISSASKYAGVGPLDSG